MPFRSERSLGEPMDLSWRLLKASPNLEEQFMRILQESEDLRRQGKSGLDYWKPLKESIKEEYGDEPIPGASWKQPFGLEGFDPEDESQDFEWPEGYQVGERGPATPSHFSNQLRRIPMQNEPTARKILQMALNAGQGRAEGGEQYSLSDFVDFGDIQTSEPMDLAWRLLKQYRQTRLGEWDEDFPSRLGPVTEYHGTTNVPSVGRQGLRGKVMRPDRAVQPPEEMRDKPVVYTTSDRDAAQAWAEQRGKTLGIDPSQTGVYGVRGEGLESIEQADPRSGFSGTTRVHPGDIPPENLVRI